MTQSQLRVSFLASGNGSSMRAAVHAIETGALLDITVSALVTNREQSGALDYSRLIGIPAFIINERRFGDDVDRQVMIALESVGTDAIFLSGYLRKLGPLTLSRFAGRIMNVHPALLPAFGGKGMYGDHVHRAVLAAGEKVSGATVHLVNEEYDSGPILSQMRVPIPTGATIDEVRSRVSEAEATLTVHALSRLAAGGTSSAEANSTKNIEDKSWPWPAR